MSDRITIVMYDYQTDHLREKIDENTSVPFARPKAVKTVIDVERTVTEEDAPLRHMELLAASSDVQNVVHALRPKWSSNFRRVYMEHKLGRDRQ